MCIKDILVNKVKYHNVIRIDSGTCINTIDELHSVMRSYDEACWCGHSYRKAYAIMQRLLFDGKLSQARRYGGSPDLSGGTWTPATDEDIIWFRHTHPTEEYDTIDDVMADITDELKDMTEGRHPKCFE